MGTLSIYYILTLYKPLRPQLFGLYVMFWDSVTPQVFLKFP